MNYFKEDEVAKKTDPKERKAIADAEISEMKRDKMKGVLYDKEDMNNAIAECMEKMQIHLCDDCQEVVKGIIKNANKGG
jgi:hypothetical protein